jgi:cytoskeleton protein RodZ
VTWTLFSSGPTQPGLSEVATLEEADPMPTASTGLEAATVKVTEQPLDGDPLATVEAPLALPPPVLPVIAEPPAVGEDVLGAFIQKNVAGAAEEAVAQPLVTAEAGGRTFGSPDAGVRLVLKANRNIWLLIEDGKGNRVATQLLNKGDQFRVPNKPGLVATVQDGGAITYMIDGVEKGVLGQPGAVLAAESLDIKTLEGKG